jgi:CRP/FNR family transcriptional regulator
MESVQTADNVCDFARYAGLIKLACSRCTLHDRCLPQSLSAGETHRFEQIVTRLRPFQRGEHLFLAGDEFRFIATVRTGCFKSYVIDHEGKQQVLEFAFPGDVIGLDAIHAHQQLTNVVALETSAVCWLSIESISSMSRHVPELQAELLRVMSSRISELESTAGQPSADERVALFLISISENFSRRGYSASELHLPMSRHDIASYLRLTVETVSRVLSGFQNDGVLRVGRKKVSICDHEKLKKIAGQKILYSPNAARRA